MSWKGVGEVGRGADGPRREVRGGEKKVSGTQEGRRLKTDHSFEL